MDSFDSKNNSSSDNDVRSSVTGAGAELEQKSSEEEMHSSTPAASLASSGGFIEPPTSVRSGHSRSTTGSQSIEELSGIGSEDDARKAWREGCNSLKNKYDMMRTNPEIFGDFHDVSFEVGSGERMEKMTAHRLILSMGCQYFEDYFHQTKYVSPDVPLAFPELDPFAFRKTLEYIYSDHMDPETMSDPVKLVAILDVAKYFCYDELFVKCDTILRSLISSETVVNIYRIAVAKEEKRLEVLARDFISSNIEQIFSSPGLLSLSEDDLCALLNLDGWFLEETQVFANVKQWCMMTKDLQFYDEKGTFRGDILRTAMGNILYAIRFPLMGKDEFLGKVVGQHWDLFQGQEFPAFFKYFCNPKESVEYQASLQDLASFSFRPRGTKEEDITSVFEDESNNCTFNEQSEDGFPENNTSEMSYEESERTDMDDTECCDAPPTKKARVDVDGDFCGNTQVSPPPPAELTLQRLDEYIDELAEGTEREHIQIIDKTLWLTPFRPKRIHLPNLTEFRLRLESKQQFSSGLKFKEKVRKISGKLHRFLFFDKNQEITPTCKTKVETLLKQNVNISLYFGHCLIFSINHKEGSVCMNLLEHTRTIMKHMKTFPLKKLAISECRIESFEMQTIQRESLEVLVIRQVEGLSNNVSFLRSRSLKQLAWDDVGSKKGSYLVRDFLFQNKYLEKLSLANCKLVVPAYYSKSYTFLEELYLDNCSFTTNELLRILSIFPRLKRVQLNSQMIDSTILYNILSTKSASIEWIYVWGLRETQEKAEVGIFLTKIFGYLPPTGPEKPFILEKVEDGISWNVSCQTSTHVDDFKWKGTMLKDLRAVRKFDFEHFSYDEFYSTFEAFEVADKPEEGHIYALEYI